MKDNNENLNSISFRSKLLANPQMLDEETLAYLEENPSEKEVVKAARHFDKQISEALDVEVPEGLQARILLKQSMLVDVEAQQDSSAQETKSTLNENNEANKASKVIQLFAKRPFISALAASVFTVGFSLMLFTQSSHNHHGYVGSDAIVAHVLEHLNHEPSLLPELELEGSPGDINELFASVGAQLNKPVEGMKYAGFCDIEGHRGLHIVMKQDGEPVTIIVMPGHQLAASQAFEKSGYKGNLVPVKGGMVAIVADTMEQVKLAEIRFFAAVQFA